VLPASLLIPPSLPDTLQTALPGRARRSTIPPVQSGLPSSSRKHQAPEPRQLGLQPLKPPTVNDYRRETETVRLKLPAVSYTGRGRCRGSRAPHLLLAKVTVPVLAKTAEGTKPTIYHVSNTHSVGPTAHIKASTAIFSSGRRGHSSGTPHATAALRSHWCEPSGRTSGAHCRQLYPTSRAVRRRAVQTTPSTHRRCSWIRQQAHTGAKTIPLRSGANRTQTGGTQIGEAAGPPLRHTSGPFPVGLLSHCRQLFPAKRTFRQRAVQATPSTHYRCSWIRQQAHTGAKGIPLRSEANRTRVGGTHIGEAARPPLRHT
jgi:hypothetical protein